MKKTTTIPTTNESSKNNDNNTEVNTNDNDYMKDSVFASCDAGQSECAQDDVNTALTSLIRCANNISVCIPR